MRRILIALVLLATMGAVMTLYAVSSYAQTPAVVQATPKPVITCSGTTKAGNKCKRRVKTQGAFCYQHKLK